MWVAYAVCFYESFVSRTVLNFYGLIFEIIFKRFISVFTFFKNQKGHYVIYLSVVHDI